MQASPNTSIISTARPRVGSLPPLRVPKHLQHRYSNSATRADAVAAHQDGVAAIKTSDSTSGGGCADGKATENMAGREPADGMGLGSQAAGINGAGEVVGGSAACKSPAVGHEDASASSASAHIVPTLPWRPKPVKGNGGKRGFGRRVVRKILSEEDPGDLHPTPRAPSAPPPHIRSLARAVLQP
mmetsp:Transcript_31155/g.93683  ORF Transcript_31155/g.93683 Transcript_31155/m.93683 type:complete len:185 (-) Transcript_31155:32-586(-)